MGVFETVNERYSVRSFTDAGSRAKTRKELSRFVYYGKWGTK